MTLSYNIRQTGDVTILDLSGRLSLGEAVASGPGSVGALTTARNQGADLKLLNPTSAVRALLETTNLFTVFDVQNDEAAAIQAFSKGIAAKA